MVTVSAGPQLLAQDPTSVDVNLLNWPNQKIAREYTIAEIAITGVRYLDTAIVSSISGLRPGDKFVHPGNDVFAKAINNLWRQKLFSNVKIYITKIVGGGKKRNSFTVAYNASKYSNGYNYLTGQIDKKKSDTNYLKTNGFTISLSKQLKWTDDYFSLL